MNRDELLSEGLAFVGSSILTAAGTALSDAVNMGVVGGVLFLVDAPAVAGTVNFQVLGSPTVGGTYTAIAGTQITALVAPGKVKVNVRGWKADSVAPTPGAYLFLKGQTVVTGTATVHITAIGSKCHYKPDSDQDLPLAQTVNL